MDPTPGRAPGGLAGDSGGPVGRLAVPPPAPAFPVARPLAFPAAVVPTVVVVPLVFSAFVVPPFPLVAVGYAASPSVSPSVAVVSVFLLMAGVPAAHPAAAALFPSLLSDGMLPAESRQARPRPPPGLYAQLEVDYAVVLVVVRRGARDVAHARGPAGS